MPEPDYACAIIADRRDWLLLELRPPGVRFAAGMLTCFGGRREAGEDALTTLKRELDEELGWTPADAGSACDLWQGTWFIARFFRCAWDPADAPAVPNHVDVDDDAPFARPSARGAAMSTSPTSPQRGAGANVAVPVWAPWPSLPGLPLSPWHAAVLQAVQAGRDRVDLPA